ncbi:MAG: metal-dependent hydrolase [Sandaracinaceae bacterium]|nr:metal-dependent hydrolase [Sandaracinaceae bacterium]
MMKKVLMMGACALALAACEGNRPMTGTDAGGRVDSGSSGTDSGTPRPDGGGSGDDCEASGDDAVSTVGCNGGVLGAARTANDFGGLCTVGDDTNPAGSCTNTNGVCWGVEGGQGICVTTCTPSAANYVSTGGCPTGSRCFDPHRRGRRGALLPRLQLRQRLRQRQLRRRGLVRRPRGGARARRRHGHPRRRHARARRRQRRLTTARLDLAGARPELARGGRSRLRGRRSPRPHLAFPLVNVPGHLASAYLLVGRGSAPRSVATLAPAWLGALLPDLLDKPAMWSGITPYGRTVGHSLLLWASFLALWLLAGRAGPRGGGGPASCSRAGSRTSPSI